MKCPNCGFDKDKVVSDPKWPESGSESVMRGGSAFNSASYLRSGYRGFGGPVYRGDGVGFRLIRKKVKMKNILKNDTHFQFSNIPSGTFQMGSNFGCPDEKPVRVIEITEPFEMQTTQVTQSQWKALMGNNPSKFKGDDLPVENVSWNDAQEFIKKLNEMDDGYVYSLPTEAQWEYACADSEKGWYSENSGGTTHPVGQLKPNKFGLYDMLGNVWEWCEDWYGPYKI